MSKAYVGIYCKIGCDQFPIPAWSKRDTGQPIRSASGDEIVEFLMAETGYAWDQEKEEPLGGDRNIWTLCTNEKVGILEIWEGVDIAEPSFRTSWRMGMLHVNNVRAFIAELLRRNVITSEQHDLLMMECQFAEDNFNIHYDIADYLVAIRSGQAWKKPVTSE